MKKMMLALTAFAFLAGVSGIALAQGEAATPTEKTEKKTTKKAGKKEKAPEGAPPAGEAPAKTETAPKK
jgi:hypothetical protein